MLVKKALICAYAFPHIYSVCNEENVLINVFSAPDYGSN